MRWVTARKFFLLAVLVAAALIAMRVTALERTRLTSLESMFRDAIAPVQISFTWLGKQANHLVSFPSSMIRAGERNQALEEEVARLRSQVIQLNEYVQENKRLSSLLQYKQVMANDYNMLAASVVGRDPDNWFGMITLNRGASDGVQENMTVLTPEGLVGRVVSVSRTTCDVLLITDPRSGVGALIQAHRTSGIIEGTSTSAGMARMIHIPNNAPVEVGQAVITSGLGSVFPKNIPVGEIVKIESEPSGLFNRADIRPFADLSRLEEVLIVIDVYA